MASRIYLTEDDPDVRELVRCTLQSFSYEVRCFESAEAMLEATAAAPPDLFLLDIMLPGMDGLQALRLLRADETTAHIPVLMLTAKSGEIDKVTGLDSGADDYIAKPFGVLELAARVRAALRRDQPAAEEAPATLKSGPLTVDCGRHTVALNGRPVSLTLKEYDLLCCLMRAGGRVLSREELLNRVWGYTFEGETRTLDMHIRSLRQKLGDSAEHPAFIKTVRGVGYAMV